MQLLSPLHPAFSQEALVDPPLHTLHIEMRSHPAWPLASLSITFHCQPPHRHSQAHAPLPAATLVMWHATQCIPRAFGWPASRFLAPDFTRMGSLGTAQDFATVRAGTSQGWGWLTRQQADYMHAVYRALGSLAVGPAAVPCTTCQCQWVGA